MSSWLHVVVAKWVELNSADLTHVFDSAAAPEPFGRGGFFVARR
jgi:hypothetical protein